MLLLAVLHSARVPCIMWHVLWMGLVCCPALLLHVRYYMIIHSLHVHPHSGGHCWPQHTADTDLLHLA